MTNDEMIALVTKYFGSVDRGDLEGVLSTLSIDCKFSVETHGIELAGHGELRGMFDAAIQSMKDDGSLNELIKKWEVSTLW